MTKTFRQALLEYLDNHPKVSLRSIAEGAGVSYEQLKKVKQIESRVTNVEDARKISAYLGMTLEEFIADPDSANAIEVAELIRRLSKEERAALLGAGQGMLDHRPQEDQQSAEEDS